VTFTWRRVWHFQLLLGCLALLPLLLLRENRRPPAGWALLPPMVAAALLPAARRIPSMAPFLDATTASLVGLAFALSALWLAASRIARGGSAATFFRALLGMAAAGLLFGLIAGENRAGLMPCLATHLAGATASLLGLAGAARLCRRRFSVAGFSGGAVLFTTLGCVVFAVVAAPANLIGTANLCNAGAMLPAMLASGAMFGFVSGVAVSGILVMFLAVGFKVPLFRRRFEAVFRLAFGACLPLA